MFDINTMRGTVAVLQALLETTPVGLAHVRPTADAWTLTEIVGHLVDSASNNHQRFARLRLGNLNQFPGYEAEQWVAAQNYDGYDFPALAALWTSYNNLLLHLAETTPEEAARNTWTLDGKELTLDFLVRDYYDHMAGHIDHYRKRLDEAAAAQRP